MNVLWEVKEVVEARLEHFSGLLVEAEKCEPNPFIPDSLSDSIDLVVENKKFGCKPQNGCEFLEDLSSGT